jgi:N-methylhydantoinase B
MGLVERELLANGLRSIADDMAVALARSSRSMVVRDHLDFSTAVFDPEGRLVTQGTCLAVQLGAMPFAMRAVLEYFGSERIGSNDVILTNDPFEGGATHLPDFVTLAPIDLEGERCGYVAILAHKLDIGGIHAGGLSSQSREIFSDGFRIPPMKLIDDGVRSELLETLLTANVRIPDKVVGDLWSQVAAMRIGQQRMVELAGEIGPAEIVAGMAAILDYSEAATRARIEQLPNGRSEFTDYVDDIVVQGESIPITVGLEVRGDEVTVDYSAMPAQVDAGINATICNSYSLASFALRALIAEDIPVNDGFARALHVKSVPGTITHAVYPAAVGARGIVLYRLWDALLGAIGKLMPEHAMAAGDGGYDVFVFSGQRHDGSAFILTELLNGSWGARAKQDGIDGISHPAINMSNTPIELLEAEYPLLVTEYAYAPDTFGDGEFRGGCAIRRSFRARKDGVSLSFRGNRSRHASWGVEGGGSGTPSRTVVQRADGSSETLEAAVRIVLNEGESVTHTVCGAGGSGDAADRDPARLEADRRHGYRSEGA